MSSRKNRARARAGSFQTAVRNIETDSTHHLAGPFNNPTGAETPSATPSVTSSGFLSPGGDSQNEKGLTKRRLAKAQLVQYGQPSKGFWHDVYSMRWMINPETSFKMLLVPAVMWLNWNFLAPDHPNPFSPILFISYPLADSPPGQTLYGKGYLDLAFLAYYVVFFCFVRQFIILYGCLPLARSLGITRTSKIDRFGEQGYAIVYFSVFASYGLYVMKQLPTWFYRTEHFWLEYPHWRLIPSMKAYYLLQASYWIQQLMILALRLEKPRKDFPELIAHHIVTLWLIGWSYLVNLTWIGNAIFITMDFSDVFLALAKCLNYSKMETSGNIVFALFVGVWTYTRHYLNLVMLYSVWTEFDLIKEVNRQWRPVDGVWLTWWMKYQIFVPIALIQALNIFWYFLIWRILIRAVTSSNLADERSDDEEGAVPITKNSNGKAEEAFVDGDSYKDL